MARTKHPSQANYVEPDWSAVGAEYCAGIKSNRQIAEQFGISEALVRKKAKAFGWEKSLAGKIQRKADEIVQRDAVRDFVRAQIDAHEEEIVDANAKAVADVRLRHRRDILKSHSIVAQLYDELAGMVGAQQVELLEQLGELMRNPDQFGQDRLNDLYRNVISLPTRAKTMKMLADSQRVLVGLEREAFGMESAEEGKTPGGVGAGQRIAVEFIRPPKRAEDEEPSDGRD